MAVPAVSEGAAAAKGSEAAVEAEAAAAAARGRLLEVVGGAGDAAETRGARGVEGGAVAVRERRWEGLETGSAVSLVGTRSHVSKFFHTCMMMGLEILLTGPEQAI